MHNTKNNIAELAELTQKVLKDAVITQQVDKISDIIIQAYRQGNKTIFCGNGGSSAEAQHLAAELSGKFKLDRKPIAAEACHVNSSFVTAVSNDYNFTKVYARYIEAFGNKGDILIGLSTSGTSPNIVEALKTAKEKELTTIAITGQSGGELLSLSDFIIRIPSSNVPRIQEIHLLVGHIICENVERELFDNENG